ncbi:MAG: acetate--CoA ligase [Nitrospinota bacterium]|nr:acetate--CoA ligase [Nitrospinota bacterium]
MVENTIQVLSEVGRSFPPSDEFRATAYIKSEGEYEKLYKESIDDPEGFWAKRAETLDWFKKWDTVLDYDFIDPRIEWFKGGKLNASVNCLDRHLTTSRRNKAAIIWEAEDGSVKTYTYQQLHYEVNRFANVLKKKGMKKGLRATIYMPMIPEVAIAVLACARIGVIHNVVFGGFSPSALSTRVVASESHLVITADEGLRAGKPIPLKVSCDEAMKECPDVQTVIVVRRTGANVHMEAGRDCYWDEEMAADDITSYCEPEQMESEDPLFILYTSGSTGKPKGVLHTTAGYLLYTAQTFKYIFNYHEEDTYFCTADIGWITGHSYIVYGPLLNGATSLMFEGVPTYPKPDRFWEIVDKHKVNIFYTAPTAIRALMKQGDDWVEKHPMESLKVLGSVGEPINPEAWLWYHNMVGKGKTPIVDTWWQTETGGILITPLPGAITTKPGSAARPFFGISPKILKEDGTEAGVDEGGYLVIDKPWPGMLRGTYGEGNTRMKEIYFSRFPGFYFSGDGARIDKDGDFWLMGRIDDVVNVSGHRLGTAEVESALVSHKAVAEAATVGFPHEIKGEGLYVYVILKDGVTASDDLRKELIAHIRKAIGAIATPDKLQFVDGLPKTRSGKIMRRILKKVARGEMDDLGDISTLADPSVVENIVSGRL